MMTDARIDYHIDVTTGTATVGLDPAHDIRREFILSERLPYQRQQWRDHGVEPILLDLLDAPDSRLIRDPDPRYHSQPDDHYKVTITDDTFEVELNGDPIDLDNWALDRFQTA